MQWEETNIGAKFSHYEVCLVEEDGRKTDIQKVMPDEERKARFKLLKSNTRYKACVTTIRKFATKHAEAFSETVQTKPGEMHSCNDSGCKNLTSNFWRSGKILCIDDSDTFFILYHQMS